MTIGLDVLEAEVTTARGRREEQDVFERLAKVRRARGSNLSALSVQTVLFSHFERSAISSELIQGPPDLPAPLAPQAAPAPQAPPASQTPLASVVSKASQAPQAPTLSQRRLSRTCPSCRRRRLVLAGRSSGQRTRSHCVA